ncbi:MAG: glycoside hydrolase family 13 protein [Actinomycetota bacterium]|nr:glycoside hydrolase family 13 protein [Actinomycetota bacterium]
MSITTDADWWRSAVIYQIYPKSWADSDGDGFGDIAGIRARLAHLVRLGVDAVWFSPWYRSPQADGGYDVTDFTSIDPMFGDVTDVEALVVEAHDLGLKVIVDIVPNHTSDEHAFFVEAMASEPGSAAWGRYHCARGRDDGANPPNDWRSVFGGPAWDPIPDVEGDPTGWWYLHLFDSGQPDLNWDHPDVRTHFLDILRFWLDRDIDGFRIDVAHGLVKAAGYPDSGEGRGLRSTLGEILALPQWDQPGVHEIWREWRAVANTYHPPRAFVGEVWVDSDESLAAYLRPDELHTAFNFDYLKAPWEAGTLRAVITSSLHAPGLVEAPSTWVLENHDVPRARTRYGLEAVGGQMPRSNIARPPQVRADDVRGVARARAAMVFMLGLPGSAYIYQGQELGLPEVIDLPPAARQDPAYLRTGGDEGFRDGCRVPMPWTTGGPSFGFSPTGVSWLPIPAEWGAFSVEAQTDDPGSMLELTRHALRLRRSEPALGVGDLMWVSEPGDTCLVLRRPAPDSDPDVLVAMNMGNAPSLVAATEVIAFSGDHPEPGDGGFWLMPDTAAWLH